MVLSSFGEMTRDKCFWNWGMLLVIPPSAPALSQLPIPTAPKLLVCLYHFYALKLFTPQEVFFGYFKPIIGELVTERSPIDRFFRLKLVSLTANIGVFLAKKIKLPYFHRCRSSDMCHIYQQKSKNKNLGVIYNIQKNICASPNTSKVMISLKRTGTWEGAFNLQHICRLFGLPHQVMRPINIEFIALFVTIIKSSTIFMSRSLICAIKPHIGAFFAEKLTVDQKYPSRKSVNKSNNYT